MSRHSLDNGLRVGQPPEQAEPDGAALRLAIGASDRPVVEICGVDAVVRHLEAWHGLVARALEPNVFLEPAFALTAAQHFPPAQRPTFVLIWGATLDGAVRLIGLCPMGQRRGASVSAVWEHKQATLSAPLLDCDQAGMALEALLRWFQSRSTEWAGLLLRGIDRDGPTMRLLVSGGHTHAVLDQRTRAVLTPAAGSGAPLTAKHAKELRRQARRLADGAELVFRSAHDMDAVRAATERFLELEARGWKGAKRTALLCDPALATFARSMTRLLARDHKCAIHSLELDGRPVAMGIVLWSGGRSYFWKTAFDESRGTLSPGKQFTRALTLALIEDARVELTDSCAVPDHPMIDRMWGERMIVADVLVAGPSTSPRAFHHAVRRIGWSRRLRSTAKAALTWARKRIGRG